MSADIRITTALFVSTFAERRDGEDAAETRVFFTSEMGDRFVDRSSRGRVERGEERGDSLGLAFGVIVEGVADISPAFFGGKGMDEGPAS